MAGVDYAAGLLAMVMASHIPLVNLVAGFSWFVPLLEWLSHRRSSEVYAGIARSVFKVTVLIYAPAGVLGTMITVVLFGFWPAFMEFAGRLLFWSFVIAAFMIVLHLSLIAVYWYTWGSVSMRKHVTIGLVMAAAGTMVPVMFRTVIAFVQYPAVILRGVGSLTVAPTEISAASGSVESNVAAIFANPMLASLLPHTVFGLLSTSGFVMGGFFAYKLFRAQTGDNEERYAAGARIGLTLGLGFLLPQAVFGAFHLYNLAILNPHSAMSVLWTYVGPLMASLPAEAMPPNLFGFFGVKLLLIGYLLTAGLITLQKVKARGVGTSVGWMAAGLVIAAPLVVALGDVINEASQLPFIIQGRILASEVFNPLLPPTFELFITGVVGIGLTIVATIALLHITLRNKQVPARQ